jgi:hypothetical protein
LRKNELNIKKFDVTKNKNKLMINKLSIVIPVYKEESTIHLILDKIKAVQLDNEILNIMDLLKPVFLRFADVVYSSRFMGSNPHRILFFWHTIGNIFLTFLSNVFTNSNLTDMETCYKIFRTDIIQKVSLKENRFGFEPEVTSKISQIPKIRIYEVGISYFGRTC